MHGLIITGILGFHLLPKAFRLVLGIIQLRKTVSNLLAHDKQFKTVRDIRIIIVASSQRRDLGRVFGNENRLFDLVFHQRLEQFHHEFAEAPARLNFNTDFLCQLTSTVVVIEIVGRD